MKQTAFRLTDEDMAILDEAKRRSGMLARSDALRFVLRFWAERSKVDVDALVSEKPKSKRRHK
jgi:hypothetical protein